MTHRWDWNVDEPRENERPSFERAITPCYSIGDLSENDPSRFEAKLRKFMGPMPVFVFGEGFTTYGALMDLNRKKILGVE